MRKLLRRIFHKHQYVFCGKFYKGNEEIGHTEDCYIFGCKVCKKTKKIKVVE